MQAADSNRPEIVQLLLEAGAQVNSADGWTALMYASSKGHAHVTQLLLEGGSQMDVVNGEGRTALDLAHSRDVTIPLSKLIPLDAAGECPSGVRRLLTEAAASA
eukprot:s742_g12.t1